MSESNVVFIDRDGVINVDLIGDYIKRWEDFRFETGALQGLKHLADKGFDIVIISNQAGVGDGQFSEQTLQAIDRKMLETLQEKGIQIRATHYCLHGKKAGCGCRKPETGLFEEAARRLHFDAAQTFYIGDKESDIEAGKRFGLKTILVRTGYGRETERTLQGSDAPDFVADNLEDAAERVTG